MTDTTQHIGDAATGATAGAGFMHIVTDNATFISISVMVVSAVVAIVFHVLNHLMKRKELNILHDDHTNRVVAELMQCMDGEQDRAALKRAAHSLKCAL